MLHALASTQDYQLPGDTNVMILYETEYLSVMEVIKRWGVTSTRGECPLEDFRRYMFEVPPYAMSFDHECEPKDSCVGRAADRRSKSAAHVFSSALCGFGFSVPLLSNPSRSLASPQ